MPPAAATHQIVGETDRLNQVPHITSSKYIFNGVPDDKGKLKLQELGLDHQAPGQLRGCQKQPGGRVRISDLGVWIPELLVAQRVRRVPSFRGRVCFPG